MSFQKLDSQDIQKGSGWHRDRERKDYLLEAWGRYTGPALSTLILFRNLLTFGLSRGSQPSSHMTSSYGA